MAGTCEKIVVFSAEGATYTSLGRSPRNLERKHQG